MPSCPIGTFAYTVRPKDTVWMIARRYRTTVENIAAVNPELDVNNINIGQTICIPLRNRQTPAQPYNRDGKAELTLSNLMRLLWEQHVYWTRMAILGMALGLPDTDVTTNRLLRNPNDFKAALRPFIGEANAAKFATLLTQHLTIAAELVNAVKTGNSAAAADAEKRWYANADEIAAFLNGVNPYWSAQEWKKMLYNHLAMTKAEAVDILTGKYADSVSVFDSIEQEALAMVDYMTQGILKQYFK